MTATFEQLVKVRSQLAEEVLSYLTQLEDKLDQTDWWCGGERIKASEVAIKPVCLHDAQARAASAFGARA